MATITAAVYRPISKNSPAKFIKPMPPANKLVKDYVYDTVTGTAEAGGPSETAHVF